MPDLKRHITENATHSRQLDFIIYLELSTTVWVSLPGLLRKVALLVALVFKGVPPKGDTIVLEDAYMLED